MEIDFRVPETGPSAPLWQAFRDKKRIEWTNNSSCIPPHDILALMEEAGYSFRLNGEPWSPPIESKDTNPDMAAQNQPKSTTKGKKRKGEK